MQVRRTEQPDACQRQLAAARARGTCIHTCVPAGIAEPAGGCGPVARRAAQPAGGGEGASTHPTASSSPAPWGFLVKRAADAAGLTPGRPGSRRHAEVTAAESPGGAQQARLGGKLERTPASRAWGGGAVLTLCFHNCFARARQSRCHQEQVMSPRTPRAGGSLGESRPRGEDNSQPARVICNTAAAYPPTSSRSSRAAPPP